ncbi:MAG: tol-pal system protein YbgF [Betaproteobacteria bacterium]|jgi:tol-pal system protein YbgF|nr:tol-pal system protein YbgF [Betaproteobacteria bacterium]NBZ98089.1 tol-pal system protein YbgF [Betaproteobacteria bacterium]NDD01023.1 tol-pal system protein YbgF [Betaproteobacteria bacterium]NDD24721.1 tol-pal system protein YbgF [Betaproteobacteria bacterium]NDF78517.1 tol-pal system protein YbgF [Betaproteobacteria bacterium]
MKHSVFYRAIQWSLVVFCMGFSVIAQAGLFEDDEARRAILDLRQKLDVTQQGLKAQAEDVAVLRRALLELQNQIEALKAEQSALRGANEQLLRELSDIQLKQKDVLQTVDSRLSKFEPIKVVLDGLEFQADPAEKREYEAALAVFRTGDFAAAQNVFLAFLRRYPTSGYASSTLFWLGNAQYATKDYKESIVNFRKLLSIAPQHTRAAEAMLAISNCLVELKDIKAAKKAMEDLVKEYPSSEAAQTAKDRLARLR